MANGRRMLRFTVITIALVGVLGFHMEALGMLDSGAATIRPDVIMIDTIAKLEELEQPAAVFKHDAHTSALKKQGMSCESCHTKDDKGVMTLTFKRVEGEGASEPTASQLKEIYHDGCISCHVSSGDKGFKTGPMVGECRSCHQEKPEVKAERVDAGMDNILHYAHWNSKEIPADPGAKTNCKACHNTKDKEDGWRFDTEFAQKPVNEAFHNQCVTCHQSLVEKKAQRTGPVECASCHGAKDISARKAKEVKTLQELGGTVPRLPRKQPDAVLLMPKLDKDAPAPKKAEGMAPVAFNHKFHENAVDTCRVCHVEGVNAPMDTSFNAMHDVQRDNSCIGCHAKEQQRPECASCHGMRSDQTKPSDASCMACHTTPTNKEGGLLLATASKEAKEAEAVALIATRSQKQQRVSVDQIPETVTIDGIAKEYGPSKLPHRKIVLSLMDKMKDDSLAATFHATPTAMCQGCHHNSPASVTPPKCASCHTKPFTEGDSGKPGLKAAYHGQCMSCHTAMKLEKPAATNCVACHEKKTK